MFRILRVFAIVAILCEPSHAFAEGKLREAREAVRRGDTKQTNEDGKNGGGVNLDDLEDDEAGFRLGLITQALMSPFIIPYLALEDDWDVKGFFLPYPYYEGRQAGFWRHRSYEHLLEPESFSSCYRSWMGRLSVENGNDFDGLNRTGLRLLVDTSCRFGVQTSWSFFNERLSGNETDDLWLGDINLTFRFAQSDHVQMRTGLGARFLFDECGTEAGFNFLYSMDLFPAQPWVISGLVELGTLGDAGVVHGLLTTGWIWRNWELYLGYDYLRIGSADLQGPLLGVRLWF